MKPEERIIAALDVPTLVDAEELLKKLQSKIDYFKVGSELYTSAGPDAVRLVKNYGGKVFLDLKFHDIPNTVHRAVRAAAKLGVDMLNFHACGGLDMMRAAVAGASEGSTQSKPILLAVTVLTSINDSILASELRIEYSASDQVLHLAVLAEEVGADGVVASPQEIRLIREDIGKDFTIVTPGVRPEWSRKGDQKRTMTPRDAIDAGADYIVIGRPITAADDPAAAVDKIIEELG